MPRFTLHAADNLDVLMLMSDNSVDSIVTDPPYGLSFMGKKWDYDVPPVEVWAECLRVLKPGGHLLAFAGARTQHRMAVRIEDAGFEIRDMIAWVYGSGFPKSLNIGKALAKTPVEESPDGVDCWDDREKWLASWSGWGTALKPAIEPITVARKPLIGTVADNVLAYTTGGVNIDACRVPLADAADAAEFENNHRVTERLPKDREGQALGLHDGGWKQRVGAAEIPPGRWPANLIHDGSAPVERAFPGGEARFFYCAKASRKDRGAGNDHPTVKPTDLMRYLCRLVTPAGGLILDPYTGSGSTGVGALLEGFDFVGIDNDPDSIAIAQSRLGEFDISDLA